MLPNLILLPSTVKQNDTVCVQMFLCDYFLQTIYHLFDFFVSGLTMCYQRLSVNNNNHNNLDAKPTHMPPLHYPHGHRWNEPFFDLTMPKNITSLVGKSAYLGCRVKHLGNKTVSTYTYLYSHYCQTTRKLTRCWQDQQKRFAVFQIIESYHQNKSKGKKLVK